MIGRREAMAGIAVGSIFVATPTQACTIVAARRHFPVSVGLATQKLREFASFLSSAHALPDNELIRRADDWNVSFDPIILEEVLGKRTEQNWSLYDVYPAYSVSEGKLDRKPVKVTSVELLRQVKGRSLYQTTFERFRWRSEISDDDCGGNQAEGYYPEDISYLAIFAGSRLRSLKSFPEWLDLERY